MVALHRYSPSCQIVKEIDTLLLSCIMEAEFAEKGAHTYSAYRADCGDDNRWLLTHDV